MKVEIKTVKLSEIKLKRQKVLDLLNGYGRITA